MKTARVVLMGLVFLGVWGNSQECRARVVRLWSLSELQDKADLVVVGVSGETVDGTRKPDKEIPWKHVVTTFELQAVLKADPKGTDAARDGMNPTGGRHTRHEQHSEAPIGPMIKVNHFHGGESWENGPGTLYFDGQPRSYLLFLKRSTDGNYQFATGPWDPGISIRIVGGYRRPESAAKGGEPDWDKFDEVKYPIQVADMAVAIATLPADQKAAAFKRLQLDLASPQLVIRRRAAVTLKILGNDRGVPILIADFPKTEGNERMIQAQILRTVGDRRAIPVLRQGLDKQTYRIRNTMLAALGELRATEAFHEIVAQLAVEPTQDYEDPDLPDYHPVTPADYSCYALGMLGDMRAVPILIEHLKKAKRPGPARHALETLKKQHEEQQRQKLASDPEKWAAWWKKQAE